jgi:hypothetical protein
MTLVSDRLESTFGLIKPDAVRKGYADRIFSSGSICLRAAFLDFHGVRTDSLR